MATGLRSRVRRLLKATQEPSDVLILKDGTEVHLGPDERFAAYCAVFAGQPHRLLDLIAEDQIDREQCEPDAKEFIEFLLAFNANAGIEED
jgi:hypothetical protein